MEMRIVVTSMILASLGSCHSHDHEGTGADEYIIDCETLGGASGASDENFFAFVDAEAAGRVVKDDALAPKLMSPAPGAMISAATPPTFTFTVPQAANHSFTRTRQARACAPEPRPHWARAVWNVVSPIGTAHAHCAAFTGENYLFRLTEQGSTTSVYTAELSVATFTPDADKWRRAMQGRTGKTLGLTLERGVFFKGSIMEGPFVPVQPITFVVGS